MVKGTNMHSHKKSKVKKHQRTIDTKEEKEEKIMEPI